MNHRTPIFLVLSIIIVAAAVISFSAIAQAFDHAAPSDETARMEENSGDNDERHDYEEYEDDEYDDTDENEDEFEVFDEVHELVAIAECKTATIAFVLNQAVESTDDESTAGLMEEILSVTNDPVIRRLITMRLIELYAELERPEDIRALAIKLWQ